MSEYDVRGRSVVIELSCVVGGRGVTGRKELGQLDLAIYCSTDIPLEA